MIEYSFDFVALFGYVLATTKLKQYKIFLTWNPREADVLVVTGPVTKHNEEPLKKIYESIPNPKAVIAAGSCAVMGGVYKNIPRWL